MLGKLAELAQNAKGKIVDAVSDVDMKAVKGRISSTVDAARDVVSDGVAAVGGRLTNSADAYDKALDDVIQSVNGAVMHMGSTPNMRVVVDRLKEENPYR